MEEFDDVSDIGLTCESCKGRDVIHVVEEVELETSGRSSTMSSKRSASTQNTNVHAQREAFRKFFWVYSLALKVSQEALSQLCTLPSPFIYTSKPVKSPHYSLYLRSTLLESPTLTYSANSFSTCLRSIHSHQRQATRLSVPYLREENPPSTPRSPLHHHIIP
jgi:hypothetical protein